MPTIRYGKQIVSTNDLCASCAVGSAGNCVFLEAMNILRIDLEGSGIVQPCNNHTVTMDVPVEICYDELFDDGDDICQMIR